MSALRAPAARPSRADLLVAAIAVGATIVSAIIHPSDLAVPIVVAVGVLAALFVLEHRSARYWYDLARHLEAQLHEQDHA